MQQPAKNKQDFLIEIHTEELPPKTLRYLAENFLEEIKVRLNKAELSYQSAQYFATPRRLAVLVKKLREKQADTFIERKGPAWEAAFDREGNPTPACQGFARSCAVSVDELITLKNDQGKWVGFKQLVIGKSVHELMPHLIQQTLAALPLPKRMRWGSEQVEFIRPVHSVVMLYGKDVLEAEILGCRTGRLTRGHRFHSKGWVSISSPARYLKILEKKYVMADFEQRKNIIQKEAVRILSSKQNANLVMDSNLLDEVTGLVEWPMALCGHFDPKFLSVPSEALMAAMQDHQRYFPVVDDRKKLLPYFVMISNIESGDVSRVIAGNERVLHARLSDADFFFSTDKKQTLQNRIENLKHIVFQAKLGTLFDKSKRVAALSKYIAHLISADDVLAERAAWLSKTDLTTAMVGEFPELQGVMGYYYALADGESEAVAISLKEQYMPRFSGDALPSSLLGCVLAIADRIDTLVGIFGIGQLPTGEKDPFGLRRAALGILRILIEKKLNLDVRELIEFAKKEYENKLENRDVTAQISDFMWERLKPWYHDQGISYDVFASVAALSIFNPYDIHLRIQAVQHFKKLPEAASLSIANKRVSNILEKSESTMFEKIIHENLFEQDAERLLAAKLAEKRDTIKTLSQQRNYKEILVQLSELREPVDDFFGHVMVMTEDLARRKNRLLILEQLRELFLHVADIALLQ